MKSIAFSPSFKDGIRKGEYTVTTRSGLPVKIVDFDNGEVRGYPILGYIKNEQAMFFFDNTGHCSNYRTDLELLVNCEDDMGLLTILLKDFHTAYLKASPYPDNITAVIKEYKGKILEIFKKVNEINYPQWKNFKGGELPAPSVMLLDNGLISFAGGGTPVPSCKYIPLNELKSLPIKGN